MSERPMCEVNDVVHVGAPSTEGARFFTIRRMMVAAIAASVALIGPSLTAGETQPQQHHTANHTWIPDAIPLPQSNLQEAPATITPEAQRYVTKLFKQPKTGLYQSILNASKKEFFNQNLTTDLTPRNYDIVNARFNGAVAQQFGLHVVDPESTLRKIDTLESQNATFAQEFVVTKQYLAKLGIQLQIAGKQDKLSDNFKPLSEQDIQDPASRRALANIVSIMAQAPREYYDFIRQSSKTLTLTLANNHNAVYKDDKGDADGTYAAYASFDFNTHTTGVTLGVSDAEITTALVSHELEHLVDPLIAGGAAATQNDPGYTKYNNGVIYQHNGAELQYVGTPTVVSKAYNRWGPDIFDARLKGDYKTACKLAKEGDEDIAAHKEQWAFITPYAAQNNVAEDKAEVGSGLFSPLQINSRLSLDVPLVHDKFMFYTKRFAQYAPRLVGYFVTRATAQGFAHTWGIPALSTDCDKPAINKGG